MEDRNERTKAHPWLRRAQHPLPVYWVFLIRFAVSGSTCTIAGLHSCCDDKYGAVTVDGFTNALPTYTGQLSGTRMISGPLCNTCCSMQKRSRFNSASNIHITYVLLKKMMLTIKAHNSGVISQELQKAAEILKDLSQDTPASESRLTSCATRAP